MTCFVSRFICKLTRKQFYYRECEVAFNDNRYFDTGHATNSTGKLIGIIPSELEDVDGLRISNGVVHLDVVHLEHLPCALLVQVENVPWFQLAPDLPPRTIVISPQKVSTSMVLPKKIFVPSEAKTLNELKIYREGFNVSYCHAVTDYYAQGKTISEPVILDLHLPENLIFRRHLFFHWVTMLSRSETDEKIALLEPLWSGGNTQNPERTRVIREFRKYLKYPPDLAAELSRVMRLEKVNAQKVIDKLKAEENWDGDLKQRLLETLLSVQKNGSVPIITSGSRRTSRTTKPIKCIKRSLPTKSSSVYKPLCRKRVKTSPDSVSICVYRGILLKYFHYIIILRKVNLICRASPGMKTNIASATVPAEFQLIGGKTISKTSMQGLLDGAWVVDDIIYIFIKLLLYKVLKKPLDSDVYEPTQGICVLDPTFDSMFFQRGHCTEHRYKVPTEAEAKEALEYMKQPVIRRALETQLCLIPINFYGYHWSLIVIDKMQQKLYYIDSKDLAQTEELLNVYLCAYKETTGHCLQIERVQNAIIRQHNNRDCGALVCKFIEAIITAENRSSVVDAVNQINGKLGKQYRLQIHNFISGFVIFKRINILFKI